MHDLAQALLWVGDAHGGPEARVGLVNQELGAAETHAAHNLHHRLDVPHVVHGGAQHVVPEVPGALKRRPAESAPAGEVGGGREGGGGEGEEGGVHSGRDPSPLARCHRRSGRGSSGPWCPCGGPPGRPASACPARTSPPCRFQRRTCESARAPAAVSNLPPRRDARRPAMRGDRTGGRAGG